MRAATGQFTESPKATVEDLRIVNHSRTLRRVDLVKGVVALLVAFVADDQRTSQSIQDLTHRLEQAVQE